MRNLVSVCLTIFHRDRYGRYLSNLNFPKASHRLGVLRRAKSFLGTTDLLTTYKTFIRSLMDYCSPLSAGAPAWHLAWLYAV